METVKDTKDLRIEELEKDLTEANEQLVELKYKNERLKEDNIRLQVKNNMCGTILRGLSEEL